MAHGSLYAWGGYFAATLGLAIGKGALPSWLALPALFAAAIVIGGLLVVGELPGYPVIGHTVRGAGIEVR